GGEFLYRGGMHLPYPPAWAVLHVPFSLVSPHVAQPAFFAVGVLAFLGLGFVLHDLTRRRWSIAGEQVFWVLAGTVLITSHFWRRDFDDGGQNIVLLSLTWLGIWLFLRGRKELAGASLGLAVALKCTAGLMLLFFLLKRQWGMFVRGVVW